MVLSPLSIHPIYGFFVYPVHLSIPTQLLATRNVVDPNPKKTQERERVGATCGLSAPLQQE